MSFFGPYTGARRALHQLRCRRLHSVEDHAKCPTVPQRRVLVTGRTLLDKAVNKSVCFTW